MTIVQRLAVFACASHDPGTVIAAVIATVQGHGAEALPPLAWREKFAGIFAPFPSRLGAVPALARSAAKV